MKPIGIPTEFFHRLGVKIQQQWLTSIVVFVAVRPLASSGEAKPPEEEEDRSGSPLGPGGPFACSQCRGAYPTRDQLERHETLHSPSTQVDTLKYVSEQTS